MNRPPWYAWVILALAWAFITVVFWYVFASVPRVGHWLRWVLATLPTWIVLPFVIGAARKENK